MNYLNIIKNDLINGPGVRTTLFVSGCTHDCSGCFNKESHNFKAGEEFGTWAWSEILSSLEEDHVTGLTLTGGDPFMVQHGAILATLARTTQKMGRDVWAYTGFEKEEIRDHPLTQYCDVIICGKFEEDKVVKGELYGSSNQYIWEPKKDHLG